ncbi:sigma-70 family RNA polymerase sigma factor [Actinotalea solisilvae]|uniref:sigma-70 family RNA polymerase sigma factor n=1 Tax=Actinotalea solisilvae TaxID=2072922 RepID=UPI0027DE3F2A|nr:sigma-70 family RNA polymerase sigma factor [Actinotalea solisilvae]
MDGRRRREADEAMATLARERGKALVGYAYLLTGHLGDAEDLVQDALVRTFVRATHVEPRAAESYVRRAILTTYIDGYRRRRRWDGVRHLLAGAERDDALEDVSGARLDVRTALLALPPQQRACVVLRFYDDLTVPEIATRLGLGDGTVKRYLSLAVHRMEGLLGPLSPAPTTETLLVTDGDPS